MQHTRMGKTGTAGDAAGQSRELCLRSFVLLQPSLCQFGFNPEGRALRLLFLSGVLVFLIVIIIVVEYLVPKSLSEIKNIRPAVVVGIPGGG